MTKYDEWKTFIARDLLTEDGIIFISIDDNEQAYLRILMDEIFGEENFIANIIWNKLNAQNDAKFFESNHEYILTYAKNIQKFKINKTFYNINSISNQSLEQKGIDGYLYKRKNMGQSIYFNPETNDIKILLDYDPKQVNEFSGMEIYKDNHELLKKNYQIIRPSLFNGKLGRWRLSKETMEKKINLLSVKFIKNLYKVYERKEKNEKLNTYKSIISEDINNLIFNQINNLNFENDILNISSSKGSKDLKKLNLIFPYSKNTTLIKYLINLHPNKNAKILDFFVGSGTTGHAILELNREDGGNRTFTLVTNNENNIAYDITYERLYKIIKGVGTDQKTNFQWIEKNKPFLNTYLDVYNIEYFNISINENEDTIENIIKKFKLMLENFGIKNLQLYNETEILLTLKKLMALRK
ncbi:DNA methyltransferase [[Mycoplasma] collis]|uniref:DNA methyltransferase n=1 Tax=[Mycoplasma] collis TaxID=2127 RepID=UPI00068AC1B6|nr:site-specific DNA-methyltransferase [[Mycoplasma] collis]